MTCIGLQTAPQPGKVTGTSLNDGHLGVLQQVREDRSLSPIGLLLWDTIPPWSHKEDQECISGWKKQHPIPNLVFPSWQVISGKVGELKSNQSTEKAHLSAQEMWSGDLRY